MSDELTPEESHFSAIKGALKEIILVLNGAVHTTLKLEDQTNASSSAVSTQGFNGLVRLQKL